MDNDAHELAEAVMRRLEHQDRKIEAQATEIGTLKRDAEVRRQTLTEILEMLRTMGDTCYAVAAAADRLTADL